MGTIDLNAARAARAEKTENHEVKIGDAVLPLPAELPADVAFAVSSGAYRDALSALLGEHTDAFFAQQPSTQDVLAFLGEVGTLYGFGAKTE